MATFRKFLVIGEDGQQTHLESADAIQLDSALLANVEVTNSAQLKGGADMNSQKITSVAAGTVASDGVNFGQLSAEQVRAMAAEGELEADLLAEITRATGAEATLTANLNSEIARATAAETAEQTARIAADTALQAEIDAEELRAAAAESALGVRIDNEEAARAAGDLAERNRAMAAEGDLQAQIDAEESARIAADLVHSADIAAEIAARQAADLAESTARSAADSALQAEIDAEEAARAAGDVALQAALDQEILNRTADVNAEETRAMAAEAVLSADLAAEIARATAAEAALDVRMTAAELDIDRIDGDSTVEGSFRQAVLVERTRAMTAEAGLSASIDSLRTDLTAETAARVADVDAEEARALAAEALLQGEIDAEETLRASEDVRILTESKAYTDTKSLNALNDAKAYADARVQGIRAQFSVYSVLAIEDLASPPAGLISGEKYLVKAGGETSHVDAGIYSWDGSAFVRIEGYQLGDDVSGYLVYVENDTEAGTQYFVMQSGVVAVGTTPISFSVFSRAQNIKFGHGFSRDTTDPLKYHLDLGSAAEIDGSNKLNIKLGSMSGMSIASGLKIEAQGALSTDGSGLMIETDSTLSQADGFLKVDGLRANFQIGGVAVSNNVTAANMNVLVAGAASVADDLHRHEASVVERPTTETAAGIAVVYGGGGGNVVKATSSMSEARSVVGFIKVLSGGQAQIITNGLVDVDMSGVTSVLPGEVLFLSATGGVCRLADVPAGHYVVAVGSVHSSGKLEVRPQFLYKK